MKIVLFLILVKIVIGFDHEAKKNQHDELDRIERYEIIQVDTSLFDSDYIIELDAFGQHYKIGLIPNEHIHPGKLHHVKGNHAEKMGHKQFYTHLNQTCHYHGRVLNDETSKKNFVALALCNHRGIRGMIVAFGDTLYIKPAKTFLDLSHDKKGLDHNLNDDYFVFLSSNYNTTGYPFDGEIRVNDEEKRLYTKESDISQSNNNNNKQRRRMANKLDNLVEMLIVSDPAYTQRAKDKYASNTWYDELVSDFSDLMNGVSAEYYNQVESES